VLWSARRRIWGVVNAEWCKVLATCVRVADSVRREVEWCNNCWWSQSGKLKCCRSSEVKGVGQLARACTIFTHTLLSDHSRLVLSDVILYAVLWFVICCLIFKFSFLVILHPLPPPHLPAILHVRCLPGRSVLPLLLQAQHITCTTMPNRPCLCSDLRRTANLPALVPPF
jgi:hypothetical protein